MARLSAVFVAVCMVLIAGSLGVLLYVYAGLSGAEAAIVALAAVTALAVYNAASSRMVDRRDVDGRVVDLSRGTADLARQVIELGRRVAVMEAKIEAAAAKAAEASKPLADEIGEIGTLITQLAESVAAHDAALRNGVGGAGLGARLDPGAGAESAAAGGSGRGRPAASVTMVEPARASDRAELGEPERAGSPVGGRFTGMPTVTVDAIVREAIEANRIDLLLQPVVMLPQRKVRYYEAVARLRTEDGDVILPADFLPVAERIGLIARLDNAMLFRGVQVVRRLLGKNREVGLFCNVAPATLVDAEFFPQFNDFADANRALAPSLIFEFTQAAYRAFGPMENESLAALVERGFRFSLDHVTDLRLEPRDLADRGFRFAKIPAALLLNHNVAALSDIHPADLAGLLSRYGVELIAERIESEAAVVDLLDFDVKFGQGFLFSPPRPVRPEVLQGAADRHNEASAAETPRPAAMAPHVAPRPPAAAPAPVAAPHVPMAATPVATPQVAVSAPARTAAPEVTIKPDDVVRSEPAQTFAGTALAQIARAMLARK